MKCTIVPFCIVALALTGCRFTNAADPARDSRPSEVAQGSSGTLETSAPRSTKVNRSARDTDAPIEIYREVKRLNTACERAGGGVSGSPNCDAGNAKEDQLKKLGYCIDYPNGEKLVRCEQLSSRR